MECFFFFISSAFFVTHIIFFFIVMFGYARDTLSKSNSNANIWNCFEFHFVCHFLHFYVEYEFITWLGTKKSTLSLLLPGDVSFFSVYREFRLLTSTEHSNKNCLLLSYLEHLLASLHNSKCRNVKKPQTEEKNVWPAIRTGKYKNDDGKIGRRKIPIARSLIV